MLWFLRYRWNNPEGYDKLHLAIMKFDKAQNMCIIFEFAFRGGGGGGVHYKAAPLSHRGPEQNDRYVADIIIKKHFFELNNDSNMIAFKYACSELVRNIMNASWSYGFVAIIRHCQSNALMSIQFNSKSLLFHQVQMNIEHSFKYTITNMIAAWGQPFVIFPSCIFFAVENRLIAQAPQQRNQQWWHFTGGCPTKVLNCSTQNKTFLLY